MILADKIIKLRKKNGWSQEELAEKVGVSRQAVSKWESAQAIPDVEKIIALAELFGVSTDYLLKDSYGEDGIIPSPSEEEAKSTYGDRVDEKESGRRIVTLSEAKAYVEERKRASLKIAIATFLCILSPIALIILSGASEIGVLSISENVAGAIGLSVLFAFVVAAVPIYVLCGIRNEPYKFLDDASSFELEGAAEDMLRGLSAELRGRHVTCNVCAVAICVFSPVPLIIGAFSGREFLVFVLLGVTIAIAGIGVFLFILSGVRKASIQRLLREGEFEPREKKKAGIKETVGFVYWTVLVAIFLVWGFLDNAWHINWVVFAVGGVLFAALMAILNLTLGDK